MTKINVYLNFMGFTEEAMNFYKSVFGGNYSNFQRFRDIPGGEKMEEEEQEKIMNAALQIGHDTLMASDALKSMGQTLTVGNNFYLSASPSSMTEADRLFGALSSGGQVIMAMNKAFWGAYFGMLTDKFGIQWMINYQPK
jgi:PhnB protein